MKTREELCKAINEAEAHYNKVSTELAHLPVNKRIQDHQHRTAFNKWQTAKNALDRFDLEQRRELVGIPEVINILRKEFKISVSKRQTTAVRGYTVKLDGYIIHGDNKIELIGIVKSFDDIVARISEEFNVTAFKPIWSLAMGWRGSITIISKK